MKTVRLHAGLFKLKEASTSEQRYEKEEWKGKLHAYGVQSATRAYSPLPLPPPPPDVITGAASLRAISPPSPPPHRIMDRFWQPRPKSRMASFLESVSMIAEFGQQQWSCMNFRYSDRTLRSRDRIFKFSREMWKFARNLDTRVNFGMSGRYNQPVQYGRDAAHKSRAAWAIRLLGVYMSERQHIYQDLNETSSARPGGSQQLEVLPSPNSKRTPNFSANILASRRNFI